MDYGRHGRGYYDDENENRGPSSNSSGRNGRGKGGIKSIIKIALIAVLAVIVILNSFTVVSEGYTGTKYRLGQLVTTDTGTGAIFHFPFIEQIKKVDIRTHVYQSDMTAYTKDTQVVESLKSKASYMYDRSQLDYIIRNIGINNVETTLIVPNVSSITKNMTGKYKGEELIQNRSSLQEDIEQELRDEMSKYGIIITAYNIEDIDFEDSFEDNIRQKVAAEVEAQTTKNKTATLEEEARQKVIAATAEADAEKVRADAEAYAIKVVQEQLNNSPEYVELQRVQKWDGKWPEVMGNTVNPFVTMSGN